MQWDSSKSPDLRRARRGFAGGRSCDGECATLSGQSDSVLSLYRTLIGLRNSNAALNSGRVEKVASNGRVLRYERIGEGDGLRSCSI